MAFGISSPIVTAPALNVSSWSYGVTRKDLSPTYSRPRANVEDVVDFVLVNWSKVQRANCTGHDFVKKK